MIGKYIKRLWKNWPNNDHMIMAEDLNRYEDYLKEHDDRLLELANIDTRVDAAEKGIKSLQNMSQASANANALVTADGEEKLVGTICGRNVYQKAYLIQQSDNGEGAVSIFPFEYPTNGDTAVYLVDVQAAVAQYSVPDSNEIKMSTLNCLTDATSVTAKYIPSLNNMLMINYSGFDSGYKKITVVVKYITEIR